jgi:hypothetical protein
MLENDQDHRIGHMAYLSVRSIAMGAMKAALLYCSSKTLPHAGARP